jgi:hypothetical protein
VASRPFPTDPTDSEALASVTGLAGKPTIDTCNIYDERPTGHPSLTLQIKDIIGGIDPGARLLEDSSGLTRAIAAELGPFFYRYASVGDL